MTELADKCTEYLLVSQSFHWIIEILSLDSNTEGYFGILNIGSLLWLVKPKV